MVHLTFLPFKFKEYNLNATGLRNTLNEYDLELTHDFKQHEHDFFNNVRNICIYLNSYTQDSNRDVTKLAKFRKKLQELIDLKLKINEHHKSIEKELFNLYSLKVNPANLKIEKDIQSCVNSIDKTSSHQIDDNGSSANK